MAVLQDFCKLSMEYLKRGPNPKLYQSAAQKLNVQPEVIRNAVEGLVHLLVRSCKQKYLDGWLYEEYSEWGLEISLNKSSIWLLEEVLKLNDLDFRDSMLTLGFSEAHQEILSAFFENKKEEILNVLNNYSHDLPHFKDLEWRFEVQLASRSLQHQITPLITMKLSLENRRGSVAIPGEQLVLQTDPTNLVHLTQVLEEALLEARSQHTRRFQRYIK
ncbi:COMM domain-containing protein 2 [Gryllus bimaculatus]|nr:COMM domain-containing protein 2 [Gryllus bimaculatus]